MGLHGVKYRETLILCSCFNIIVDSYSDPALFISVSFV